MISIGFSKKNLRGHQIYLYKTQIVEKRATDGYLLPTVLWGG
jgi:hypothetical protein